MSRCQLDNHPDGFDVVIGWDPEMGTFFARVSERGADDPFLCFGAVDQHLEPDRLIEAIRPYACAFDEELLGDNLRFDQHANSGRHYDATLVATTPDLDLRASILRTYDDHNSLINPRIEPAHFASLVRIAAHYGHPKAAADLAFMYQHGFKGAPQDRTKAAKWASVAVEQDLAAGTTHSLALGVDKLRFFSPEDDENAFITDEGEESETIPEGGSYVTITPMRPAEHYLGRPRPRASPGSFDGDDGIKRVFIGAIIIGVIGVVALLLVV